MMSVLLKNPQDIGLSSIRKHVLIYKGKYRKRAVRRKWTDREYHVQDNADVAHTHWWSTAKTICNFSDWSHFLRVVLMVHIYHPVKNQHLKIFPIWSVIIVKSRFCLAIDSAS